MVVLLLLFIVVPIIELFVIIEIGQLIGVWPTIGLLLLSAVLGSVLLRSQGRAVWARFNQALAESRVPHKEVFDGALVILGGALLLTPGFVTDIAGVLLLLPPSRAAIRGTLSKLLLGRAHWGVRTASWGYNRYRGGRPPGGSGYDVDGTAEEVRDRDLIDRPPPEPRT